MRMPYPSRCERRLLILLASALLAFAAQQPWRKDARQWTVDDAQRILGNSPWAQTATVAFPQPDDDRRATVGPVPEAPGMSGPNAASDGRWDGGVGKLPSTRVPTLPIAIRWDSALPVREAVNRLPAGTKADTRSYTPAQAQRDYIITVAGLVPAGRYRSAGQLPTASRSDEDTTIDPQDPEQMLEGLMGESRLLLRGRKAILPEDVKLDAATGTLHLFFPRTVEINLNDKDVTFATRFGSMNIQKQFHLKEMVYQGKLEL